MVVWWTLTCGAPMKRHGIVQQVRGNTGLVTVLFDDGITRRVTRDKIRKETQKWPAH